MRDLNKLFNPSSVAIIGASSKEKSVGLGLVNNILYGKDNRKIFLVNPNQGEIEGMETFSKVGDIKDDVDLAVIAVPAKFVEQVVQECCQKKVGSIVIISSGFSEPRISAMTFLESASGKNFPSSFTVTVGFKPRPHCLESISASSNEMAA